MTSLFFLNTASSPTVVMKANKIWRWKIRTKIMIRYWIGGIMRGVRVPKERQRKKDIMFLPKNHLCGGSGGVYFLKRAWWGIRYDEWYPYPLLIPVL